MTTRKVEMLVGLFVAIGIAAFFMLALQVSNLTGSQVHDGYLLTAKFTNVGGLKVRSPVSAGGVVVGRVASIEYDPEHYQARVVLNIDARFATFPIDTSAAILTSGLLGEQYVGLQPGAEDEFLQAGGEISITQSALVLEQVISKFLFSKAAE